MLGCGSSVNDSRRRGQPQIYPFVLSAIEVVGGFPLRSRLKPLKERQWRELPLRHARIVRLFQFGNPAADLFLRTYDGTLDRSFSL